MTNDISSINLTISEKVKCFLRRFGWSEDRKVNLETYSSEIMQRGFKLNTVAENILCQLGGISFRSSTGGVPWFRFDHQECFHTFQHKHASILETLIGETNPCPIGGGGGGGYILFAFENGVFALLHEQWFFLLISDAFANIVDAIVFNDFIGCRVVEDAESYRPDW